MPRNNTILWLSILLISGGMLATEIYLPSLPALTTLLHATNRQLQMTITLYFLSFGVSQLIYGPLSDIWGRRPVVFMGISIFIVGTLLCLTATQISWLNLGRLVQGAGMGAGSVVARAILRDVFSGPALARMTAYMSMAMAIVPILAPTLGGFLQETLGWRASFGLLLGYGILVLVLYFFVMTETAVMDGQSKSIRQVIKNYAHLLCHRVFLIYLACLVLSFAALVAYATESPFLLQQKLGLSAIQNGYMALGVGLAFLMGAFIHNQLIQYFSMQQVMRWGMWLSLYAAGISLGTAWLMSMSVLTLVGPVILFTFGMGFFNPSAMAGALAPFPHMAGTAGALIGCGFMIAGAIASSLVALLSNGTALPLALILCFLSFSVLIIYNFIDVRA